MELKWIAQRQGQLSSFLRGELRMSYALMNKLKWGDASQVNGEPQRTNFPVKPGDVITVRMEEEEPEYPAEDGELNILYEDEYLLAVDKPAGMLIHPSRSRNTGTLANFVAGYYQKTGQKSAFHPLTRLDRDTFGIVLLAKNAHVHTLLQETKVQKTYHALTFGWIEEDSGTIDAPIARRELPSLLRYVSPDGKTSVTEFAVLARKENICKLALWPVTDGPISYGCIVPTWDIPFWEIPSTAAKKASGSQKPWDYPIRCSARKNWNYSTPSQEKILYWNLD